MKILYAIQATGNGHISRAHQVIPHLKNYGTVDTVLSGSNSTLPCQFDVTYRSKGLSLFYKKCGGLDYLRMYRDNSLLEVYKDAKSLPVGQYDLVVNDFDYVTAVACRKKKVKSIQFGHQASFVSDLTPRPDKKSQVGEFILKNYAKADHYLGLHFESYDDHILPPVIKKSVLEAEPQDHGHITVYLPSYDRDCLMTQMKNVPEVVFHYFTHETKQIYKEDNIRLYPISNEYFTNSLINCHGIITGGGFETPAEALYLEKKLMSIPIRNHYEQKCNAAALSRLGAVVLDDIDIDVWADQIKDWIQADAPPIKQVANNLANTVDYLMHLHEEK